MVCRLRFGEAVVTATGTVRHQGRSTLRGAAVLALVLFLAPGPAMALVDEIYDYAHEQLAPSRHYAVVIGIDKYANKTNLNYAVNDAETMVDVLRRLGYVIEEGAVLLQRKSDVAYRATRQAITETISRVLARAGPRDRVLVFYAGHGAELPLRDNRKQTLLLPADYDPDNPTGTGLKFRDLVELAALRKVEAKQVLFVLDACYAAGALDASGLRDASDSEVSKDYIKELLSNPAYMVLTAGGEGEQVQEKDAHGIFTRRLVHGLSGAADTDVDGAIRFSELVAWLEPRVFEDARPEPQNVGSGKILSGIGQPVFVVPSDEVRNQMLANVGLDGATVTRSMRDLCREKGRDCRWLASTRGDGGTAPSGAAQPAPVASVIADPSQLERDLGLTREERSEIQRGLNALTLEAGAADGLFGEMTREAIRRYQRDAGAPETGFLTADDAKALLARGAEEQVAAATPASPARGRGAQEAEHQVTVGRFPSVPLPDGLKPGDVFSDTRRDGLDCPECPEMVVLPAGAFQMGSADGDREAFNDERPQHLVIIRRNFAVGRFPVTVEEYLPSNEKVRLYAQTLNISLQDRMGKPAANVSWDDAWAYVAWLRQQTGQPYRLLREAEWEYACRAGSDATYPWGNDPTKLKDHAWFWINAKGRTHDVGGMQPNAFGLHDMHGNVWEWVEDVWHETYDSAPGDGSAWIDGGDQSKRARRGGDWGSKERYLRCAVRSGYRVDRRSESVGFRVARDLD